MLNTLRKHRWHRSQQTSHEKSLPCLDWRGNERSQSTDAQGVKTADMSNMCYGKEEDHSFLVGVEEYSDWSQPRTRSNRKCW